MLSVPRTCPCTGLSLGTVGWLWGLCEHSMESAPAQTIWVISHQSDIWGFLGRLGLLFWGRPQLIWGLQASLVHPCGAELGRQWGQQQNPHLREAGTTSSPVDFFQKWEPSSFWDQAGQGHRQDQVSLPRGCSHPKTPRLVTSSAPRATRAPIPHTPELSAPYIRLHLRPRYRGGKLENRRRKVVGKAQPPKKGIFRLCMTAPFPGENAGA